EGCAGRRLLEPSEVVRRNCERVRGASAAWSRGRVFGGIVEGCSRGLGCASLRTLFAGVVEGRVSAARAPPADPRPQGIGRGFHNSAEQRLTGRGGGSAAAAGCTVPPNSA